MIVRVVIYRFKLLFLDEFILFLDLGLMLEIYKFFRKFNEEGIIIFLIIYNMEEVDKFCDRIVFLNFGEIVDIGSL